MVQTMCDRAWKPNLRRRILASPASPIQTVSSQHIAGRLDVYEGVNGMP